MTLISELTIQSQHGRKVLAVGDPSGISHARLPQIGPKGSRGDDRPVHRGHLPVICRQSGRHQDPAWDRQQKGHDLCCHVAHFSRYLGGPDWDGEQIFPPGGRAGPGQVRQPGSPCRMFLLDLPSRESMSENLVLFNAHHSLTHWVAAEGGCRGADASHHSTLRPWGPQREEVFNWKDLTSLWQKRNSEWMRALCVLLAAPHHNLASGLQI